VPSADKPKFQKLAGAIKQQLSAVKVYEVGDEAERDVYIVGKTSDGKWAGLKTSVVETQFLCCALSQKHQCVDCVGLKSTAASRTTITFSWPLTLTRTL
jgi:hypothetical protein